jgi:hypothetical protein
MATMEVGTVIAMLVAVMGTQVVILLRMVTNSDLERRLKTHRKRYHRGD